MCGMGEKRAGARQEHVCSVAWPFHGNEAGGDLVLIVISLLLLCKSSCSYQTMFVYMTNAQRSGMYQS